MEISNTRLNMWLLYRIKRLVWVYNSKYDVETIVMDLSLNRSPPLKSSFVGNISCLSTSSSSFTWYSSSLDVSVLKHRMEVHPIWSVTSSSLINRAPPSRSWAAGPIKSSSCSSQHINILWLSSRHYWKEAKQTECGGIGITIVLFTKLLLQNISLPF